jgi:tripartite-type tricarboxylate transporter receptor subunit TctC
MELLKRRAGIDMLHVPFKGGTPATTATVAGETAAMFSGTSTAPMIRAGKLRAIAVTGKRRSSEFPDLPTIGEKYPGYEATIWLGIFAPGGTPAAVIDRLRTEINKALGEPAVEAKLKSAGGLEPLVTKPDEFAALIRSDYDKYGRIVREVGARID